MNALRVPRQRAIIDRRALALEDRVHLVAAAAGLVHALAEHRHHPRRADPHPAERRQITGIKPADNLGVSFAKASKRDLKRVRDYISFNREAEALPKKLSKNPQYDVIGGFFPGLTVTPFHSAAGQPWEALEAALLLASDGTL